MCGRHEAHRRRSACPAPRAPRRVEALHTELTTHERASDAQVVKPRATSATAHVPALRRDADARTRRGHPPYTGQPFSPRPARSLGPRLCPHGEHRQTRVEPHKEHEAVVRFADSCGRASLRCFARRAQDRRSARRDPFSLTLPDDDDAARRIDVVDRQVGDLAAPHAVEYSVASMARSRRPNGVAMSDDARMRSASFAVRTCFRKRRSTRGSSISDAGW